MRNVADGQISIGDIFSKKEDVVGSMGMSPKEAMKSLSKKYNFYDLISAFHKELRRNDVERALYFGLLLSKGGSLWYPMKYMFQIATEEAHSPEVKAILSDGMENYRDLTIHEFAKYIYVFCNSEVTRKYAVEVSDRVWWKQNQYWKSSEKERKHGVRRFQPEEDLVVKWETLVDEDGRIFEKPEGAYTLPEIFALLEGFAKEKNINKMIYIRQFFTGDLLKECTDLMVTLLEGYGEQSDRVIPMFKKIGRAHSKKLIWFFDYQVAFLSLVDEIQNIPKVAFNFADINVDEAVVKVKGLLEKSEKLEMGLYVYDPHTSKGKRAWEANRSKFKSGAPQPDQLDIRYAGTWIGVYFRRQAYKQHGSILVNFEDVKLNNSVLNDIKFSGYYNPGDKKYRKEK